MKKLSHYETGFNQDVFITKDANPTHTYSNDYKTHYIVQTYNGITLGFISRSYVNACDTKAKNEWVFAYPNGKGHSSCEYNMLDVVKMGFKDAIYYM